MEINNLSVLEFTLRVILGLLFFFQGYDKVVSVGMKGVIEAFKIELGGKKVPQFILVLCTYYSSFVEFLCGGLLVLGLFTDYSLYLLGINLILVVGAFSLIKPMWDMQFVLPRLLLLSILLWLPAESNQISVDHFLRLR